MNKIDISIKHNATTSSGVSCMTISNIEKSQDNDKLFADLIVGLCEKEMVCKYVLTKWVNNNTLEVCYPKDERELLYILEARNNVRNSRYGDSQVITLHDYMEKKDD